MGGLRIRVAGVEARGGRTGGAGAVETAGVVLARGIEAGSEEAKVFSFNDVAKPAVVYLCVSK